MTLPLHAYFQNAGRVEIVVDNARSHANLCGPSSRKRKDATTHTSQLTKVAGSPRLVSLSLPPLPTRTVSDDRWVSNPVKPSTLKRMLRPVPNLEDVAGTCVRSDCSVSKPLDSSPTKPTRMTLGLADCAHLSLSMPRRPLRKPFIDISVVKSDRFEGTTADMISKVLEELELPDSDDEEEGSILSEAPSSPLVA